MKTSKAINHLSPLVSFTREFAHQGHGLQKYGDHPYIYHLNRVAEILLHYGYNSDEYLAVAYLHDILEDAPEEMESVKTFLFDNFKEAAATTIYHALSLLTDNPGKNRKERKTGVFERIATNPIARVVKVADRIANLSESVVGRYNKDIRKKIRMYLDETPKFTLKLYYEVRNNGDTTVAYETMFDQVTLLDAFLRDFLDNDPA